MVKASHQLVVLMLVLGTLAARSSAAAEAPTNRDRTEARGWFDQGLQHAQAERWPEALAAFQRSSELVARASTSYNIANALYRLDRPVEALYELDVAQRLAKIERQQTILEREQALRQLIEGAIGKVVVAVLPTDAALFIDDRRSSMMGPERRLWLEPGEHSVRVTHEGYEPYRTELMITPGSRQTRTIVLEPRVSALSTVLPVAATRPQVTLAPTSEPPTPSDRKPFVKRPGFWVMVGAIVVVGVGTGVAVALTRKNDGPTCGTTGTCATTEGLGLVSF